MGGGDDEDVDHVAIVTYFDETDVIDPKKSPRGGEGSGAGGSGDNATSAVEEKEALADTVDLFWLQEQIDLLSHFESSLSLDRVQQEDETNGGHGTRPKPIPAAAAAEPSKKKQKQRRRRRRRGYSFCFGRLSS